MATIKKRGNSYSIRVSCGYDMQGKQIIHSMTWKPEKSMTLKQMEKEVQKQAVLFEEKCKQGLCLSNNIRFADFAEKWFTDYAEKQLKAKTIQHYHRFISSILQTAVQWQIILYNPCDRVKPPKVEQKESRFLDDVEVMELFHCLEKQPIQYKTLITLLVYTGMRRGEVCGLKWSDIDFNNQTITIQRTLLYLPNKGIFEDTPKTNTSQRIIKVADTALQLLKEHKRNQSIQRLQCGDQWQELNYIFAQWNGKPIHPDSLTAWFKQFINKNQLPDVSIHSLRHTNASLLIANGVNITTVSKRLGHATTATTTKIYAHAIKSADEAASNTLQNILKKVQ